MVPERRMLVTHTHTKTPTEAFTGKCLLCFETGSHCVSPGWSGTRYINQAGQHNAM